MEKEDLKKLASSIVKSYLDLEKIRPGKDSRDIVFFGGDVVEPFFGRMHSKRKSLEPKFFPVMEEISGYMRELLEEEYGKRENLRGRRVPSISLLYNTQMIESEATKYYLVNLESLLAMFSSGSQGDIPIHV